MATNAEHQRAWRNRRNALAKEAEALRKAQQEAPLRNGEADTAGLRKAMQEAGAEIDRFRDEIKRLEAALAKANARIKTLETENARWQSWAEEVKAKPRRKASAKVDPAHAERVRKDLRFRKFELAFRILGLTLTIDGTKATREDIEKAFREKAMTAHPDHGGSTEAFQALTAAKRAALKYLDGEA